MNFSRVVLCVVLSAGALLGSSCSSDEPTCLSTGITCEKNKSDVEACCNSGATQCEYVVGTKHYPCSGTDCNAAAGTVQSDCTSH
jgi:hypothetical protein